MQFVDTGWFRTLLQMIPKTIGTFIIGKELRFQGMDQEQDCVVEFTSSVPCTSSSLDILDKKFNLVLNILELSNIVGSVAPSEQLTFYFHPTNLEITKQCMTRTCQWTLPGLPETTLLNIITTKYACEFTCPIVNFQALLKDIPERAQSVFLRCTKKEFQLNWEYLIDGNKYTGEITQETDPIYHIKCRKQTSQVFRQYDLKKHVEFQPLSSQVHISLDQEQPLKIRYPFEYGSLCFYLSPVDVSKDFIS